MKPPWVNWLVPVLLFFGLAAAHGQGGAFAQPAQASIRPDPLTLEVGPGEVKTLDIVLENAQEVYGIDLRGQFDPQVVEVVDADPTKNGVQMTPGAFPYPDFVVINASSNITGTFQYVITQVNPTPPASGSGRVLSFQLRGKQGGETAFKITSVQIADRFGNPLPAASRNGTIKVLSASTQPSATATGVVRPSATSAPVPASTNPAPTTGSGVQNLPATGAALPAATHTVAVAVPTDTAVSLAIETLPEAAVSPSSTPAAAEATQGGAAPPPPTTPARRGQKNTTPTLMARNLPGKQTGSPLEVTPIAQMPSAPEPEAGGAAWLAVPIIGLTMLIGLGGLLVVCLVLFVFLKRRRSNP